MCPCDYDDQAAAMVGLSGNVTCRKATTAWKMAGRILLHIAKAAALFFGGAGLIKFGEQTNNMFAGLIGTIAFSLSPFYAVAPALSRFVDVCQKTMHRDFVVGHGINVAQGQTKMEPK